VKALYYYISRPVPSRAGPALERALFFMFFSIPPDASAAHPRAATATGPRRWTREKASSLANRAR